MDNQINNDTTTEVYREYVINKHIIRFSPKVRMGVIEEFAEDISNLLYSEGLTLNEQIYAIYFDVDGELMGYTCLGQGDDKGAIIDFRKFICVLSSIGASKVTIVHNHPNGKPHMSDSDYAAHAQFVAICTTLRKKLQDFIILTEKQIYSHKLSKVYDYRE